MGYKGVIFDLDGTLVNSIEDIGNSLNTILDKYNYPILSLYDYENIIGQGLYQLVIDSLNNDASKVEIDKIYQEFTDEYSKNYLKKTKPYPKILNMLKTLQDNKILIGVNSNKKDQFTKEIVETLFKDIKFTLILGDRKNINKKPDPISINEIIEAMQLDKSEVVFVGDSEIDILSAQNAQIDSIGVSWGYRSRQVLIDAKATNTVSKVDKLLRLILD